MKRMLFVMCLLLGRWGGIAAEARDTVYVYGVDYSQVRVLGTDESETRFVQAFLEINDLFLNQPEKYDCGRMIRGSAIVVDVEPVCRRIASADYSDLRPRRRGETPAIDEAAVVAGYDLAETHGVGIVFIAEVLDKGKGIGIYRVVRFDTATRKVIDSRRVETKAGGFGLRNYWANTVYLAIRAVRFY